MEEEVIQTHSLFCIHSSNIDDTFCYPLELKEILLKRSGVQALTYSNIPKKLNNITIDTKMVRFNLFR